MLRILGVAVTVVALAVALAPTVEAQRNCRKGIPCGNSCISASKVCRIGSSSARPAYDPPSTSAARPAAVSTQLAPQDTQVTSGALVGKSAEYPWVGSFADGIYFRAGCSAARDLAPTNRRYFSSDEVAQGAGYRRSSVPGC